MIKEIKYTLVITIGIMLIGKVIINSFSKEVMTSLEMVLQSAEENMPFYTYSSGEQLENYKSYYAWLKPRKRKPAQQVADSVKKVFGPMKEPQKKRDIIDSAIYAVFHGTSFKEIARQSGRLPDGGKYIYVFSLEGEPMCKYVLDHYIYGIWVDEATKTIMATDVNNDQPIVKFSFGSV